MFRATHCLYVLGPFDKKLILVLGKGGVGRSTVAATIASATATRGRKTLLFQSHANDRFGGLFGQAPVGPSIKNLDKNLWAVNTTPTHALEEYGIMVLRFKRVYKLVFENRLTKYFLRAIPGLDDYSVLGKAWFHTTEEKNNKPVYDTVIFDMAASGHSLSMLKLPQSIVSTVPDGPLTRDAAKIKKLIHDPSQTSVVITTLAEEMPSNEAIELKTRLKNEIGLDATHLVINQIFPNHRPQDPIADSMLAELCTKNEPPQALAPFISHTRLARSRNELNEQYISKLNAEFDIPVATLPFLFESPLGPKQIVVLRNALESAWTE